MLGRQKQAENDLLKQTNIDCSRFKGALYK